MQALLRQFSAQLPGADASLFFYAGHGLQVERRNWMVPVDAALQSEIDLPFEGVAVDTVLELMEDTTPLRLVFLDACRDNPLARRLARSAPSRSLGVGRGLARMNNRIGTLIAFATEPDQVAFDGDGNHSPFTDALLDHMETPGIEVRQMLSRVRATVIASTDGQQLPLDTSALVEDFYFVPPEAAPAPEAPVVAAPPAATGQDTELLFWSSIQASSDPNDFQAYLERYPEGAFAPLARNRLSTLSREESDVAALTPPQQPVPAPQPVPAAPAPAAPAPAVEIEPLEATMVATRNVNLRGEPNTDGEPQGVVPQGAEVAVVGKVVGANWYRIRRPEGGEGYVYAPLFAPPEAVVADTRPEPSPVAAAPAVPPQPPPQAAPTGAEPDRPEPAQMAAVAPNVVAPRMSRQQVAPPGAVPRPQVDAAALLQTLGERGRSLLRFTYRIRGEQGTEFVAFDRWEDAGSDDDAPTWNFANAGQTRVQTSSETFGQAVLASQVTPELFGVLMYSQLTFGGRATFSTVTAESALKPWAFLAQNGARVQSTSSLVLDGVQLEVAALTLNPGAPASSCLGFVAIQVSKRADGFVCRTEGPAFDASQASPVLSQINVPRFIEP
jgi:hypothetical protein